MFQEAASCTVACTGTRKKKNACFSFLRWSRRLLRTKSWTGDGVANKPGDKQGLRDNTSTTQASAALPKKRVCLPCGHDSDDCACAVLGSVLLTWMPTRRPGTCGTWRSRRDFDMCSRTALSTTEAGCSLSSFFDGEDEGGGSEILVTGWERRREMKFPAEFVRAHQIDVADPSLASTTGTGKAVGRDAQQSKSLIVSSYIQCCAPFSCVQAHRVMQNTSS